MLVWSIYSYLLHILKPHETDQGVRKGVMAITSHAEVSLLDFPPEILRLIVLIIYQDGNESVRSLKELSCTCTTLRELAIPLLFHTKTAEFDGRAQTEQPCWVFRSDLNLRLDITIRLAKHITVLRMVLSNPRGTTAYRTWQNLRGFVNVVRRMDNLRTISFTPPIDLSAAVLDVSRHRTMHIIIDFRSGVLPVCDFEQWVPYFQHKDWTWSFALGDTLYSEISAAMMPRDRVKALALEWTEFLHAPRSESLVTLLNQQHFPILEEVHVSGKAHELSLWHGYPLPAPQIALFVSSLTNLRRLRVEGASFTNEVLKIMPHLSKLEDLSIYSSYRAAFHPGCSEDCSTSFETEDLPWLQLPKLRKLDIRFICEHFTIQQFVPCNLLALRIEFYGANDRFGPADLTWLAEHSPDLERLELDIGDPNDIWHGGHRLPMENETSRSFDCLQGFRKLRVLRLFPTYWSKGRLRPHPFSQPSWPVTFFSHLQSICPCLRTLIICISYGEYPFDVIERMSVHKRPIKFVVKSFGDPDELVAWCGHAGIADMVQMTYRAGRLEHHPIIVSVPVTSYFDDLGEDWILSHADTRACDSWSYRDHWEVALSLIDDVSGAQKEGNEPPGA